MSGVPPKASIWKIEEPKENQGEFATGNGMEGEVNIENIIAPPNELGKDLENFMEVVTGHSLT